MLELSTLGFPEARRDGQPLTFKTRKTLALFVYLALEPGWHSRDKLIGLLWPDSGEELGRGSLRKCLTMLRQGLGVAGALRGEGDRLSLVGVRVTPDAADLEPLDPGRWGRGVLAELSLSDAPAFDDWLETERQRQRERLDGLLRGRLPAAQAAGATEEALRLAKARLALDPLSEAAHLELMRLHWGRGENGAAIETFRRLRARLRQELGVEPSPEALRLLQLIQGHSGTLARPTLKSERSVNQVPLVGREREWALMEAAWERGQAILLGGEAGVGKTRLGLEFAASRGSTLRLWGRQGDLGIPYATHMRNFGYLSFDQLELAERLPDWVRSEMARILPWLGEPPPPIRSQAEKLRFFEAKIETYRIAADGFEMLFFDDTQFVDAHTTEAGMYLHRQLLPYPPGFPRAIFLFRTSELSPYQVREYAEWVRLGKAVRIELEPLAPQAVEQWLAQRGASGLTDEVMRLTGGNPLLIHETLQAAEGGPLTIPLPRSQRARQVLEGRLSRLEAAQLRLVWVAALAGTDFSPDMGERVLGLGPDGARPSLERLQASGIFRGKAFSHDLLHETAVQMIPPVERSLLSRAIAEYLVGTQPFVVPARLARLYRDGQRPDLAARHFLEAARQAEAAFAPEEAAAFRAEAEQQRSLEPTTP